jgi:hypothetical protein
LCVSLLYLKRRQWCIRWTMDLLRVLFQALSLSHTPPPVVHALRKYFSSHTLHIQDIRATKGRPRMNKKQRPS